MMTFWVDSTPLVTSFSVRRQMSLTDPAHGGIVDQALSAAVIPWGPPDMNPILEEVVSSTYTSGMAIREGMRKECPRRSSACDWMP